ncbi:MAG: hypothetical protein OXI52_12350 [Caldilineaceae bacterium]|nr:hypothetical protein [Caldilineaceae bacterium]
MKHTVLLIALALLTISCVPIPPTPTDPPEPKVPVGIRDLASALAKSMALESEEPRDTDQYSVLLYDIIHCSPPNTSEEELYEMFTRGITIVEHNLFFSPSEIMSLAIFNLGIYVSSTQFMFINELAHTTDFPESQDMYAILEFALELCESR